MTTIQQLLLTYEVKKPAKNEERRRLVKLLMVKLELNYFQVCNNNRITPAWNDEMIKQALNHCESYTAISMKRLKFKDYCVIVNV